MADKELRNAARRDKATTKLLTTAREQLLASRAFLQDIYSSAAFVLARGAWNPEAKMAELSAQEGRIPLTHEKHTDLLNLGKYRVVVAYAPAALVMSHNTSWVI
ncbi:MAG: hypothetical protein ACLQU4_11815 [Limisphaerales bacterium]